MQVEGSKFLDKLACFICNKKFNNMFVTEHQCKRCLRSVCKQCCSKKKQIFTVNINNHINSKTGFVKPEEHRTCDVCLAVSEHIAVLAKNNMVTFAKNSKLGNEWADLLEMNKPLLEKDTAQQNKNSEINKLNILTEVWSECSSSLRELLGLALAKVVSKQANQLISKIAAQCNSKANESLLSAYILCYCDEAHSLKLVKCLSLIKSQFSIDNVTEYLNLLIDNDKQFSDKNDIKSLLNFTNKFAESVLNIDKMFLTLLPVESINQIIHEALLASSPTIIQLIASFILYYFKDIILNPKITDEDIRMAIKYRLNAQILDKGIKSIRNLIIKKNKKSQPTAFNINFLSPEKIQDDRADGDSDEILKKINEASEYLRKIEEGEITDEEIDATQMQNLDKYLDLIIAQNDKSLNEIDAFDKMLSSIEQKIYKSTKNQ